MYHRPFINRGALQTRESQSSDDERHEGEMNLRRREGENKSIGQVERSFSALQMLPRSGNVEVRRSHIHNWGLFTMREHQFHVDVRRPSMQLPPSSPSPSKLCLKKSARIVSFS